MVGRIFHPPNGSGRFVITRVGSVFFWVSVWVSGEMTVLLFGLLQAVKEEVGSNPTIIDH